MLNIDIVGSSTFDLFTKLAIFSLSLIAWQLVFDEYRQNKKSFYQYMNIAFSLLLIQSTLLLVALLLSIFLDYKLPQMIMPILDHFLKIASFIYLSAAFLATFSEKKTVVNYIKVSFSFIFVVLGVLAYAWRIFLLEFPGRGFSQFGGDLLIEQVLLLIGLSSLYLIWKSPLNSKTGFALAIGTLIITQGVQITNLLWSYNTLPLLLLLERCFPLLFFYFIIISVHKEILSKLDKTQSERNLIRAQLNQETIRALVSSLEAKDEYTKGHSDRVTQYAVAIGRGMGMTVSELEKLYFAALLHDIGKIGITENVLNHPSFLDRQQIDMMKKHPEIGAQIISKIEPLHEIAPAVLHHHEWYDGTGYPFGLKGHNIPLYARIIAIADAIDAMASTRIYRSAISIEQIVEELKKSSGTQFDPDILEVYLKNVFILPEHVA